MEPNDRTDSTARLYIQKICDRNHNWKLVNGSKLNEKFIQMMCQWMQCNRLTHACNVYKIKPAFHHLLQTILISYAVRMASVRDMFFFIVMQWIQKIEKVAFLSGLFTFIIHMHYVNILSVK